MKSTTMCLSVAYFVSTIVSSFAYYEKCYKHKSICLTTENETLSRGNQLLQTLSSAKSWCINNDASLAVIPNETVQDAITKFIRESTSNFHQNIPIRVDASSTLSSNWQWVNGDDAGDIPFQRDDNHPYAYLSRGGGERIDLSKDVAPRKRKFICYSNVGESGCSGNVLNGRCYHVKYDNLTWYEARSRCLKEHTDLAIFQSNFNFSQISFLEPNNQYWIGLQRETWLWGNGEKMNYTNWVDNFPNPSVGKCLCLNKLSGKWTNCNCDGKNRFVCIKGADKHTDSESMSITTSTAPTDPTALDVNVIYYGIGLGIVVLLLVIAAVVLVVLIRRKRKRALTRPSERQLVDEPHAAKQIRPSDTSNPNPVYEEIGTNPDTVYAKVTPSGRTMSDVDHTPAAMIYAELDMPPKKDEPE